MTTSSRVFVIGNAAVDETLLIDNFPVPGMSIHGQSLGFDLGGKGLNQATVLARCGIETTLIAAVGNDDRARSIEQGLAVEPVKKAFVRTHRSTDISVILRDPSGENSIITTTASADAMAFRSISESLVTAKPGDVLVVQGNLSFEATLACFRHARKSGMLVVANPSPLRGYFAKLWQLVDVAFVNEQEASVLSPAQTAFEPEFCWSRGVKAVVRSLGKNGAELHTASSYLAIPAKQVIAVDTAGAGDTFLAVTLASAMHRRVGIDHLALSSGVHAAALVVTRAGTFRSLPSAAELYDILSGKP